MENVYMTLWQIYSEMSYQISSKSPEFCRRCYKKPFDPFFSGHSVLTMGNRWTSQAQIIWVQLQ